MAQTVPLSEFGHFELVEYFDFLDDLRESGATNMSGASSNLQEDHGLTRNEAAAVLTAWRQTFDCTISSDMRVDAALEAESASS